MEPVPRLPPLNALKAFEASGRHLNFRLAAEEIGVTQGAVAQHVRALEADFQVKLFERLARGLALTDEGRKYHAPIQRAFELIRDASDELRPQQGVVTISVTPSFATKWLVPRLAQFTASNPDLNVQIVASADLANFQDDGIDLAVRQGRAPSLSGLVSAALFPAEIYAVCSPALLQGDHPLLMPEDLEHHTLLLDGHGLWPLYIEEFVPGRPAREFRSIRFNQTAHAVDAALSGQGVALAGDLFVADELASGRLVRPFQQTVQKDLGFFIVAPRKSKNATPVKRMWDWLIEQSRTEPSDIID
ncbi:LysR substrate-binding domain-containing protein [Anderseniella sp. Alg231-50]|uniref:LysR substrate-binding domain-containing protein n=1 Tax=Anderseniella sp. Alg231-50 TaxID=1922226 RepID=UPI000D55F7D8